MLPRNPEKFWRYVDRSAGAGACWLWTGKQRTRNGYGRTQVGDRRIVAHKIAFLLSGGELRPRQVLLHECDNRLCCNPRHLRPGTQLANVLDAVRKGRHHLPPRPPTGEQNRFHKYGAEVVSAIQNAVRSGEPPSAVCARYGVSRRHFGRLAAGA